MIISKTSGIYAWTSLSGGQYIGSAVNLRRRKKDHGTSLRQGTHKNIKLQRAWNKYGEEGFEFSVLLICEKKDLLFFEQRAVDILKPKYNICLIAGSKLGVPTSEETKRKQALAMAGRKPPKSTRDAVSRSNKERVVSFETRQLMSLAHMGNSYALGYKQTEEHKFKSTKHFVGTTKSEEELKRRTETRKARGWFVRPLDEIRKSLSNAQKGKRWITDGLIDRLLKKDGILPVGWHFGRTNGGH